MTVSTDDPTKSLGQSEIDALLQSISAPRASARYPYQAMQQLTPFSRGVRGDCRAVQCCDISRSGLAFVLESSPEFDEFHVELKQGSFAFNLRGRVLATESMPDRKFLVRCEFIEKLEPSQREHATPTLI